MTDDKLAECYCMRAHGSQVLKGSWPKSKLSVGPRPSQLASSTPHARKGNRNKRWLAHPCTGSVAFWVRAIEWWGQPGGDVGHQVTWQQSCPCEQGCTRPAKSDRALSGPSTNALEDGAEHSRSNSLHYPMSSTTDARHPSFCSCPGSRGKHKDVNVLVPDYESSMAWWMSCSEVCCI